jgi:hypothetical protein
VSSSDQGVPLVSTLDERSPDYGWNVAKAQKWLLAAVLLELLSLTPMLGWPFYVAGVLLSYWAVYNMGDALQAHEDGFAVGGGGKWLFFLWLPYIGFIALFVLNRKATRFLRDAGYSVGLFGARGKKREVRLTPDD